MATPDEALEPDRAAAGRRALISVHDKTGIVEFAAALHGLGFEIVSTGGTARILSDGGVPVTDVTDVTGHPEVFDGRVKTLHPAVHSGILARSDRPDDIATLAELGYHRIDVVCIDLYPFEAVSNRNPPAADEELIEMIDIGGPTLLRAAAKSYRDVLVVAESDLRTEVITALEEVAGDPTAIPDDLRRRLAVAAFERTAAYDVHVATTLHARLICDAGEPFTDSDGAGDPPPHRLLLAAGAANHLRYGENPHQSAAFYPASDLVGVSSGLAAATQHSGKALSFNNYLDLDAALRFCRSLTGDEWTSFPQACTVIKHTNACGVAVSTDQQTAWSDALASDPESAFGCVIAFNTPVTLRTAESIGDQFVECVIAPGYEDGALDRLCQKKNRRLLTLPDLTALTPELRWRQIDGGWLAQSEGAPVIDWSAVRCVTSRTVDDDQRYLARFGVAVCAQVKSNCVVFVKPTDSGFATVGIGPGQTSRVEAVRIAARRAGQRASGAMMVSDAFFPFRDGIDAAHEIGITAVVQPGGSIRDGEVIDAADEHDMTMMFTGTRLFRH